MRISDWSSDVCSSDLVAWADAMASLIALRLSGSVGEVIDFIAAQSHMRLPEAVEEREKKLAETGPEPVEGESRRVTQLRKLRAVPRSEEHTSELQSLMRISYAVFCLKKKNLLTNYALHYKNS